jgi:hypothetical protein
MAYIGSKPNDTRQLARREFSYAVTVASTTTFTGSDAGGKTLSYQPGELEVYMNGVRLDPADYTATTGSSVVLGSGANIGDNINIFAGQILPTDDYVSKTSGGTMTGNLTVQGTVAATAVTGDGSGLTGTGSPSIVDNGNATAITIDSSENVGIGTSNPTAKFSVTGSTSGDYLAKIESTNQFGLKIKTTSTSNSHEQLAIHDGNNDVQFKVMGGGNVHATAINLGGTAAANRLDDYEEGTFSPIISGGSSAGTVTYNTRIGQYTKVGNLVTVWMNINWSSGNGSGSLMVKGLPFSVINTARPVFNVISENVSLASNQIAAGFSNFSDGIIMVRNISGTGANLTLTYDPAGTLFLTGTYPTSQ